MTTITIKNGEKLSRNVFKTFEDLIEEYYTHKGIVMLHSIDYEKLPSETKNALKESLEIGNNELIDFQG